MVRSDDGHTGKSAITTPQSASLTAPLTQGSPCRVPHRHRTPLDKQFNKFQFPELLGQSHTLSYISCLFCPAENFSLFPTARRFDCFIFRDVIEFSHGNTRSSCARGGFPAVLKRG